MFIVIGCLRLKCTVCYAAESSEVNIVRNEKKLHLRRVSCQILIHLFMQAMISVKCFGPVFLFMETHPNIVKRKCFMAAVGVMKILPGVLFHIYITNLLAKAISFPKHMIVAWATNALPYIIHAWSHGYNTLDEPKLDNTTHVTKGKKKHVMWSDQHEEKAHISAESKLWQCPPYTPVAIFFWGPEYKQIQNIEENHCQTEV